MNRPVTLSPRGFEHRFNATVATSLTQATSAVGPSRRISIVARNSFGEAHALTFANAFGALLLSALPIAANPQTATPTPPGKVRNLPATSSSFSKLFSGKFPGLDPATKFGKSYALVVGVGNYRHLPALQSPARDVAKVSDYLSDTAGFDQVAVLLDGDATLDNISYFLEDYFPRLVAAERN